MLNVEAPFELVGRSRELTKAAKALEKAARARVPAVLRIIGDPGIGKTLFAEHLALSARENGWFVLETTCHELQRNTPFIATTRLLLSFLQQMPDASQYTSGLESGLASLDPALALRFECEASPAPSKARYQEIFARFFDGVGSDHQLFLLCDDAQWIDADSREIIEAFAASYVVGPLAVVFASRRTGGDAADPAGSTRIDLPPLTERDAHALAAARFPHLPAVAVDAAVEHGNGIPFEIITLCEELAEGHTVEAAAGETRVRDLIASRIGEMAPREREFLQICALLGEPIEYRLLFSLYTPADVAEHVSGAARPYLMAEGAALRFRHALVTDAIRSAAGFDVPLRRRIIDALQGLATKTFADYERIAEHAKAVADMQLAFDTYFDLSGAAFAKRAWGAAIAACEHSLAIGDIDNERFVNFYARYIFALRSNNQDDKAISELKTAIRKAAAIGIRRGMGVLLSILMATLWAQGRSREAFETYDGTADTLEEDADRNEVAALGMHIAACSFDDPRFDRERERYAKTEASASTYSSSISHLAAAIRCSSEDDYSAAIREIDVALSRTDAARRQDDNLRFVKITVEFRHLGCDDTLEHLQAWLDDNRFAGKEHDMGATFRATLALAMADWENAISIIERSMVSKVTTTAEIQQVSIASMIAHFRGEPQAYLSRAKSIDAVNLQSKDAILQLVPWRLLAERDERLERNLDDAVLGLASEPASPAAFGFFPLAIVLLAQRLKKPSWLQVFVDAKTSRDRAPWPEMQWRLARGLALQALKSDAARDELQAAAQAARSLGASLFAAYAGFLGGAASASDLKLLKDLGITFTQRAQQSNMGGLSPREIEVARLVGEGKTNKGIASELFLSERTVERHIGNVFDKLQIESRAQLVRWLFERGSAGT